MYYIKNGLKKHWHWLAYLFSAFGVLTVFGTGNATQVNTITTAIDSALLNYNIISENNVSVTNLVVGIALTILVGLVLLGGIKRIGQVTEKLVPFMAVLLYCTGSWCSASEHQSHSRSICFYYKGSFHTGFCYRWCSRKFLHEYEKGCYPEESFPMKLVLVPVLSLMPVQIPDKPVKQGFFGIFEVFADTIVICTLTALVILCSGIPVGYGEAAGAELTILWFYFYLWRLGFCFYCSCHVLFCLFYYYRMGTLRCKMY